NNETLKSDSGASLPSAASVRPCARDARTPDATLPHAIAIMQQTGQSFLPGLREGSLPPARCPSANRLEVVCVAARGTDARRRSSSGAAGVRGLAPRGDRVRGARAQAPA